MSLRLGPDFEEQVMTWRIKINRSWSDNEKASLRKMAQRVADVTGERCWLESDSQNIAFEFVPDKEIKRLRKLAKKGVKLSTNKG